jgi:RNA polymerase sigma-70 factor, ECF subfamily
MRRVRMAESIGSLVLESSGPVSEVVPTTLDFASLVEQHADFVFRTLRRTGLDVAAAEDAAQQVFLVASRKLNVIVAGKERAFLYRTARNVAAELRRRSSKRAEVELIEQEVDDSSSTPIWSPSPLDEVLDHQRARGLGGGPRLDAGAAS